MKTLTNRGRAITAVTAAALIIACASTQSSAADALTGGSGAYGLQANVRAAVGLVRLDTGRVAHLTDDAPASYDRSQTVATVDASALAVATVSTGIVDCQITSNIDSGEAEGYCDGTAFIDDLMLRVAPGVLLNPDLVRITAGTISSSAILAMDGADIVPIAEVNIEDAFLKVAGVPIPIIARPLPNTVLVNAAGIRIVLNEQILTTNGDTTSFVVNAIHITVDSALQVVDADVVIGNSSATLTKPSCLTFGCPADLNDDCQVDFPDYLEFLNLYDAQDPRADFAEDGFIDFPDYLEFMNHYDAGC